jgi:hypothetical protein
MDKTFLLFILHSAPSAVQTSLLIGELPITISLSAAWMLVGGSVLHTVVGV